MWFGGGAALKKSKKACQIILNLDGEVVWSSFDPLLSGRNYLR
jgi:hypothetical protein